MPDPALAPLFLLEDEPIASADGDLLGRGEVARTVAAAALGTTGPFSIGVYGAWGTGKTSLLLHAKSILDAREADSNQLRYPEVVTVFFNAWQHERDPQPLAHLAEEVAAAVSLRLKTLEIGGKRVQREAVAFFRSVVRSTRALARSVELDLASLKISAKDAIDEEEKLKAEEEDPNSTVWSEYLKKNLPRAAVRSLGTEVKSLARHTGVEGRHPRIVVFIDDMDRCLAEDAFTLLQSIKLALSHPGFIFVMTLDSAALRPYLEQRVGHAGLAAESVSKAVYLDKLIQLPFPLRLHDDQFGRYVKRVLDDRLRRMLPKEQWEVFQRLSKPLELSCERNPRTLVRRINTLLVEARMAPAAIAKRLAVDGKDGYAAFLGLSLVRETLSHFLSASAFEELSQSQELCDAIVKHGTRALFATVSAPPPRADAEGRSTGRDNSSDAMIVMKFERLIRDLNSVPCLGGLLATDDGKRVAAASGGTRASRVASCRG